MNLFTPLLTIFTVVGQGIAYFTARLTGKRPGIWYSVLYLILLDAAEFSFFARSLEGLPATGVELLALYAVNRQALQNRPSLLDCLHSRIIPFNFRVDEGSISWFFVKITTRAVIHHE